MATPQQAAADGLVKRDALLAAWVRDARQRTLEVVADLSDEQLLGPQLRIVNPLLWDCLLYTSPSPRDLSTSRMPSSA